MKTYLSILFLAASLLTFSQTKTIQLNNHSFKLVKEKITNDDGPEIEIVNLYRENSLKLLSHVLNEFSGDCNSESLELGNYTVTNSTITFYSFWCTTGDAPVSPYGARIQVYKVDKNGKVKLNSSQVYIESGRRGWIPGLEFLYKKPRTKKEKKVFKNYINKIESSYNAKFVFGKISEKLIKKVKLQLHKKIETATKHWHDKDSFWTRM